MMVKCDKMEEFKDKYLQQKYIITIKKQNYKNGTYFKLLIIKIYINYINRRPICDFSLDNEIA